MGRALRLTTGFRRTFDRLALTWSEPTRRALLGTLNALSEATLPAEGDYEAVIPPTRRAWIRRVPRANLWVFYAFNDAEVRVLAIVSQPPVPVQ